MKVKLTQLQLIALIGVFVLILLGTGGYLYVSGLLTDEVSNLEKARQARIEILKSKIAPSQTNIKILGDNNAALTSSVQLLASRLKAADDDLSSVTQKNPIAFKEDLLAHQKKWINLAQKSKVVLPPNFYFGFSLYLSKVPDDKDTLFLGKQVVGVDHLLSALFDAGIAKLVGIRRTFDEIGVNKSGAGPGNNEGGPEFMKGKAITVAQGVYTDYPFIMEFECKPLGLRNFMNKLQTDSQFFVIRYIQANNVQPTPKHLEDFARDAEAVPTPAGQDKPPLYASGFEDVQIKMRVDLIDWIGQPATEPANSKK